MARDRFVFQGACGLVPRLVHWLSAVAFAPLVRIGSGVVVRPGFGWPALLVFWVGVLLGNAGALHAETLPYAWGYNGYGELGDGTTTDRYTPVQVTRLSGVTSIAEGGYHSLALRNGVAERPGAVCVVTGVHGQTEPV